MKRRPLISFCTRSLSAFSLIELLVVIAVMGILTALLFPAFNRIGKAGLLVAEGNTLVNLINFAGQNAMSKNALTALIAVAPDPARPNDYRGFALFEYLSGAQSWKQVSRWEVLKQGVVVDPGSLTFSDYPAARPVPDFPAIQYKGTPISSFKYIHFLPTRGLYTGEAASIRLAEGYFADSGPVPIYTGGKTGSEPSNFYRITVIGPTGRPKFDRP